MFLSGASPLHYVAMCVCLSEHESVCVSVRARKAATWLLCHSSTILDAGWLAGTGLCPWAFWMFQHPRGPPHCSPQGPPHCSSVISQRFRTWAGSLESGRDPGCIPGGLDVPAPTALKPHSNSKVIDHHCSNSLRMSMNEAITAVMNYHCGDEPSLQ